MPNGINNWDYAEVKAKLKEAGFIFTHSRGSHHYYRAFINKKLHMVTVPFHGNKKIIKPKTMQSIIRQSGLEKKFWIS